MGPEFENRPSLRWFFEQFMVADYGLSMDDARKFILLWLLHQFFPELRRTRLIPCFLGPQGAGKSSPGRMIGRLLVGPRFEVTGLRRDKEDAFVAAVTNRTVLVLDNADSSIPWLPDALATYATGQRYRLRTLFTTNEESAYSPRAILLITSRDPRFNRPDVAERLLPLQFERPQQYGSEPQIYEELQRRRGEVMGSLLLLQTHPARALPFRMADLASFGERIFAARGKADQFVSMLGRLERIQAQFAADGDGLIETLRVLLDREPIENLAVADLFRKCQQVAEENGFSLARSAQGFGRHLSNIRRVIEFELRRRLVEVKGHAGKRLVSLVPIAKEG